ncbi:MAG: UbiA family prenyltransferase [Candidatus Aenigmatarchaeota archaeon]
MFVYSIISWLRNSIQYAFGAMFYFAFFGSFDVGLFFLGLAGFVISYNSVYYLNDIIDHENDMKDSLNKKRKPLIAGTLTKKEAVAYYFISLLIGLPLSFVVNNIFGLLVVGLLFINMLHSIVMKRIGIKAVESGMFVMQFIKYSIGWFVLTATLDKFPLFIFATFSFSYIVFYLIYKKKLIFYEDGKEKNIKDSAIELSKSIFQKNRLLLVPISLSVISYVISILFYPFKLQLLLFIPLLIFIFFSAGKMRFSDHAEKFKIGNGIGVFSILVFILLFSIMQNPAVAHINDIMNESVNDAQQKLANAMPQNVKEGIDNVNYMIYSDREKLESFLLNLTK